MNNHEAIYLGRAIMALRAERGMGRRELAVAAGLSYPYMSQIETGEKSNPTALRLMAVARALGVGIEDLFKYAERIGANFPIAE